MGKLLRRLYTSKRPNSLIAKYLSEHNFKYESFVCGNQMGYQTSFLVDKSYYTYIHVDLKNKILNIYKEFDCGGEVESYTTNIPETIIEEDDTEAFIEWLDEECEYYL